MDERHHRPDWNPVTSRPGEIHIVEGRLGSAGALGRGSMHDDSRVRAYRRSAMVTALGWLAAGGIVLFVAVMLFVMM